MSRASYEPAHCVVCGHADSRVIAERDDIKSELETLWEYHTRRLRTTTPPSALVDRVAFSEHPPFRLVQCVDCGLIYRNPVEREHELSSLYSTEDSPTSVLSALHHNQLPTARRQASIVRDLLGRGGSGLEVGSYVGSFLVAAKEHDLQFEGLDLNPCVNAFTRTLGVTVHDGSLADFDTDRPFDVVAIWNAFDQLPDPRGAVHAASRFLRPGGLLAIRVPNGECYAAWRFSLAHGGRVRRAIARTILAQNNLLGFPYRWGFSVGSLTRLVGEVGFAVERVLGDSLASTTDEWTRGWARAEERVVKAVIRRVAAAEVRRAPWIEVYARR